MTRTRTQYVLGAWIFGLLGFFDAWHAPLWLRLVLALGSAGLIVVLTWVGERFFSGNRGRQEPPEGSTGAKPRRRLALEVLRWGMGPPALWAMSYLLMFDGASSPQRVFQASLFTGLVVVGSVLVMAVGRVLGSAGRMRGDETG